MLIFRGKYARNVPPIDYHAKQAVLPALALVTGTFLYTAPLKSIKTCNSNENIAGKSLVATYMS